MPSSLDDYEVVSTIGAGSYGTCKIIRRKRDGKLLVWKEMDYGPMTEVEKQMLVSEVNLLRELKHQHIVRYYDRIIDRGHTRLYIIMEYCEGGDVGSLINKMKREGRHFEEDFIWQICYQVILALKECHGRTKNGKVVLHRDLKPANIFLDNQNNVKLGDFGLARVLSHETSFAKTFVGTPYYMSPEQMNYESYNEKSDVWSLGCLLYEICALRPPFTATTQAELASKICSGTFTRIPLRYSDDLNKLIATMLRVEESKRPTMDDLEAHPTLLRYMESAKHRSSSSSNGSSAAEPTSSHQESLSKLEERLKGWEESLKSREESLNARERNATLKEKELESRQQSLILREKLAEERMARADRMMQEAAHQQQHQPRGFGDIKAKDFGGERKFGSLSRAVRGGRASSSDRGTTHSADKENSDWYSLDLPEATAQPSSSDPYKKHEIKHARNMIDLRAKLRQAKLKSNEIRRDVASKIPSRHISGIR